MLSFYIVVILKINLYIGVSDTMPNTKQKSFRISEELAIEFEVHARKTQTKEVDLITRYIEEGLKRDSNQTTLD